MAGADHRDDWGVSLQLLVTGLQRPNVAGSVADIGRVSQGWSRLDVVKALSADQWLAVLPGRSVV